MIAYTTALLLFSFSLSITALGVDITSFHPSKLLTHEDFSNILFRAVNDDHDVTLRHFHLHSHQRKLRGHNDNEAWNEIIHHGWNAAKSRYKHRILRSENSTSSPIEEITLGNQHPFLLCSSYPNLSGYLRHRQILSTFNASISNAQSVYNSEETSCFVIATTNDAVERAFGGSYLETGETKDSRMAHITFAPLSDVLKFAAGTPSSILYDENWVQPEDMKPNLRKGSTQYWTRSLLVDLIPGSVADPSSGDGGIVSISRDILNYVSAMANIKPMPAKQYNSTKLSMLRNNDIGGLSTRESFSLTSDHNNVNNMKARSADNIWSNALEDGFESKHGCGNMFDSLEIRPRGNLDANSSDDYDDLVSVIGFELILNAPKTTEDTSVKSSAWNKQCVLSLIIGLSIHPQVQTIEIAQKLELASIAGKTNPQWITQSGKVDRRPFFDSGLDGSGQVVAVADGGLDRDNCYFNDANAEQANIFDGSWDMTQRKVVNYDDTFADQKEIAMGHGTYVSGIIAGKKSSNGIEDEIGNADGVAPGSKLSFFDMEVGKEGIQDPGVQRLFRSFYNLGNGAKIMNGSWGRSYGGVYTSFCRDYDSLLRSKYADVLFVVSAGNTGFGVESSIQNPADCKNAFAVGASLSYGRDIRSKEKGIEYLADYSSRGPAADGRIKPDIVAPGHFILAPNADPSRFGECDGTSVPNVMYSLKAGQGGRYVSGTSMSAPVVAGSAAIVRQYFEEGWCNERCCGYKGCGSKINPSGSLIKAILMNGAQPLEGGVQVVPDGSILKDESVVEYDNNQGYGRLNLNYSLPLAGENNFQLHAINDKKIRNDAKHKYLVDIMSDGCDSDLRVTLAWYDPPGSVGCTTCLMNDLDVYIEQVNGGETFYPNGYSRRDWKNTVERIRMVQPPDGRYRVVVHAKNLATQNQRYSLAISGCLKSDEPPTSSPSASPQQIQTISPSAAPQHMQTISTTGAPHIQNQDVPKPLGTTKTSHCPNSELFELELVSAEGENKMTWDLIMPTANKTSEVVLSSTKAPKYLENKMYYYSACLTPNRYRFKMLHVGDASFNIYVGGQEVLNSKSLEHPQNLYSFRFRVTTNGYAPITSKRSRTV